MQHLLLLNKRLLDCTDNGHIQTLNQDGRSALGYSSSGGHPSMAALLMDQGADIASADNVCVIAVMHTLQITIVTATKQEIFSNNIQLKVTMRPSITLLPQMLSQDGSTALMVAAAHGHLSLVTLLLERGADMNCLDKVSPPNNSIVEVIMQLCCRSQFSHL